MTNQKPDEEQIFHIARGLSNPEIRSDYLEQICAGDSALRDRVEALLDANREDASLLKSNNEPAAETIEYIVEPNSQGKYIGRYKLKEQIGEGGMGTVYVAEQEHPIRRKVALKVIKPGMDTKTVVARFEAERQALALMDHPHIAKVLDAGTSDLGRPYFVMELVKGIPITDYCDRNRLTINERLVLFVQVCQAIQHAHQKGIIHRDIKPGNVLVTLHDGRSVPKVIDFGIAKALNARLTDKSIYTEHVQVVGTLLYMSPEQAELSGLDVDTRSDIYSLGVLLYELLTGTTPFQREELDQAGFDEQRRMIRDKEPPKASVRVSSLGESATAVADHRKTDVQKLNQMFRGDLDWIVLKTLEKDRTRRYETSTALADDVERFLSDRPVQARPPSNWYLFRKTIRRHKAAASWLGVVLFLIVVATTVSLFLAFWALKEQGRAAQNLDEKDAALKQAEQSGLNEERQKLEAQASGYALTSELAFSALRENNRGQFLSLVKKMKAYDGEKGFEFYFLNQQARRITVPEIALDEKISSIAFDKHSNDMLIGMIDGVVNRFDRTNRKKLGLAMELAGSHVTYSRDGRFVATSGIGQPLQIFDCKSKNRLKLDGIPTDLRSVSLAFSKTNSLVVLTIDGTLHQFDLLNGEHLSKTNVFDRSDSGFQHVAVSEDGEYVAASSGNDSVVWIPKSGEMFDIPRAESWNTFLLFGPQDVLIVGNEWSLGRYKIVDGKLLPLETKDLGLTSTCAVLSPDGKTLAIGCADYQVWIGTFDELNELGRLPHSNYIVAMAFSNDGQTLSTGGRDGKVLQWNEENWNKTNSWETTRSHEPPLAISNNCSHAYTVGFDSSKEKQMVLATELDTMNQEVVLELANSTAPATALAHGPNGQLAVGYDDGFVECFAKNKGTYDSRIKWQAHQKGPTGFQVNTYTVSDLEFSADGKYLFSSGKLPGIAKWSLNWEEGSAGEEFKLLPNDKLWVSDLIVDEPSNRLIAAGGKEPRSGFTSVYPSLEKETEPKIFEHVEWCRQIDLSPDGKFLLCQEDFSAGWFRTINLESGMAKDYRGHSSKSRALSLHPTGNRFATGSDDRSIKIWDMHSKENGLIGTLRVDERIRRLEFVDSETLLSISLEGTARIWKAPRD